MLILKKPNIALKKVNYFFTHLTFCFVRKAISPNLNKSCDHKTANNNLDKVCREVVSLCLVESFKIIDREKLRSKVIENRKYTNVRKRPCTGLWK